MRHSIALLALPLVACPSNTQETGTAEPEAIVDPLSRPEEPTLSVDSFSPSSECVDCHPDHVAQWSTSSHAYAMVDPVFRALVEVRRADFEGEQDTFCLQCHTAIGTRGGEIVPNFDWEALSEVVAEGVTCESCHRVSHIERTWNSGHVFEEGGPMRGGIANPEGALHTSEYSELHTQSEFCGACHDVVELDGLQLERPYEEWLESPSMEMGEECHDCHMPESTGVASTESTTERTLHDHRFVGVDLPLEEGFATPEEIVEMTGHIEGLLSTAASMSMTSEAVTAGETANLIVTVTNEIDGHNLPTGSTFLRQMWLEVTVTDGEGAVVYQTGHLDDNEDLRDHWSSLDPYGDPDLVTYGSKLTAADGSPELFPWRANEHTSASIPPRHDRTSTLFIPTSKAGELSVSARVLLRTHPPFLLRALGLDELIERVPTWELANATTTIQVN